MVDDYTPGDWEPDVKRSFNEEGFAFGNNGGQEGFWNTVTTPQYVPTDNPQMAGEGTFMGMSAPTWGIILGNLGKGIGLQARSPAATTMGDLAISLGQAHIQGEVQKNKFKAYTQTLQELMKNDPGMVDRLIKALGSTNAMFGTPIDTGNGSTQASRPIL